MKNLLKQIPGVTEKTKDNMITMFTGSNSALIILVVLIGPLLSTVVGFLLESVAFALIFALVWSALSLVFVLSMMFITFIASAAEHINRLEIIVQSLISEDGDGEPDLDNVTPFKRDDSN